MLRMHSAQAGRASTRGSDVVRLAMPGWPVMVAVMMRRRHLTATAHEVASVPLPFADHARMRFGGNGCECHGAGREQNERYEFAHGSILQWQKRKRVTRESV